jgi:hypothetical protein
MSTQKASGRLTDGTIQAPHKRPRRSRHQSLRPKVPHSIADQRGPTLPDNGSRRLRRQNQKPETRNTSDGNQGMAEDNVYAVLLRDTKRPQKVPSSNPSPSHHQFQPLHRLGSPRPTSNCHWRCSTQLTWTRQWAGGGPCSNLCPLPVIDVHQPPLFHCWDKVMMRHCCGIGWIRVDPNSQRTGSGIPEIPATSTGAETPTRNT